MKSTVKKISFSIVLALIMACTLFIGVLCLHTNKTVSNAAGKTTTVKVEANKTSVARGDTFKLKVTVTPESDEMVWAGMSIVVLPIYQNDTKLKDTDLTGNDGLLSNLLLPRKGTNAFTKISGTTALNLPDSVFSSEFMEKAGDDVPDDEYYEGTKYTNGAKYYIAPGTTSQKPGITVGFSHPAENPYLTTATPLVFEVEIKIDENFALVDDEATVLRFGVSVDNTYSTIGYMPNSSGDPSKDMIRVSSGSEDFKTATAKEDLMAITIRDANEEAILDGIKIGHDADHEIPDGESSYTSDYSKVDWDSLTALEFDAEKAREGIAGVASYTLNEFDIEHFHLNPIPDKGDAEADPVIPSSEGATVKAIWGKADDTDIDFTADGVISLTKTAENDLFGTMNKKETLADGADPADWVIYLLVTSEDGEKTNVYQINITIAYVRLGGLEGGKYSSLTDTNLKDGVVYNEVEHDDAKDEYIFKDPTNLDYDKDSFKSDQDRYWVYIPNDFKTKDSEGNDVDTDLGKIVLKASVLSGYGASKGIAVADITEYADGTEESAKIVVPSDPIESGSDIEISNIPKTSATYIVTLTVTANDGKTEEVYTLHLQVVSVDNSLKEIYVRGKDTGTLDQNYANGRKYENENYIDEEHPEIPKDDAFFFTIYEETVTKTGRVIFVPSNENVVIKYKANAEYPDADPKNYLTLDKSTALGYYYFESDKATITYDLEVTAEAGNAVTFTVTLSIAVVIEMKEDATFYFLREDEVWENDEVYYFRRAYPELGEVGQDGNPAGWTHGKEDLIPANRPEKFVLGQIGPYVALDDLFEQMATSSEFLRVYNRDNELVFQDGNGVDDFDTTWDGGNFLGTGWRVEYWPDGGDPENGDKPADVVWISVLGDVDIYDGVEGGDLTALYNYLMAYTSEESADVKQLETLEGRLAAYFYNDGQISAMDATSLSGIVAAEDPEAALDRYYYHKPAATPTE